MAYRPQGLQWSPSIRVFNSASKVHENTVYKEKDSVQKQYIMLSTILSTCKRNVYYKVNAIFKIYPM